MRRRSSTGGKASKTQRPKTLQRRNTPSSVAPDEVTDVARLTRERDEALERETAAADILRVIASSPGHTQPVFDAIVQSGLRLFPQATISIAIRDGDMVKAVAVAAPDPARAEAWMRRFPNPLRRDYMHGRAVLEGKMMDFSDVEKAPADLSAGARNFLASGYRAITIMPMIRNDVAIGALSVVRLAPGPLSDKQREVLRTFAAQAVIAIENTRLLNELRESLEQQTGTAEVLRVISSSPGELQSVFDTMLAKATELCEAKFATLFRFEGDAFCAAALHGPPEFAEERLRNPVLRPNPGTGFARVIATKDTVQIIDARAESAYHSDPARVAFLELAGVRTFICVPMLKENDLVGAIVVYRQEVQPFTDKQIELVTNFAAQAVIAIENTRLLNELRQRTGDLSEALEHQTATSEVLNVISNSLSDTQPVFEAIVRSGLKLFGDVAVAVLIPHGDKAVAEAIADADPTRAEALWQRLPIPLSREFMASRAIIDGKIVDVPDVDDPPADLAPGAKNFRASGYRAVTIVPMMRSGGAIGSLMIARVVPGPLSGKQIELLQSFAAQAVIAIENTRLLNELRESLEQQTATSEVLKVISSSPGELEPVFQAMLENATRICGAKQGILFSYQDDEYVALAHTGVAPEFIEYLARGPIRPGPDTGLGRIIKDKETVHVPDTRAEPIYAEGDPWRVATAELLRARSLLNVPMLKEGKLVGAIGIYREEVRPFTDEQIALVTNFAAQAVIAIENTRLLSELRQRTDDLTEALDQQTAMAEVLGVISSSPSDLAPVFDTILANATRLCEGNLAALWRYDGKALVGAAHYNASHAFAEHYMSAKLEPGREGPVRLAALERRTVHVTDITAEPGYSPIVLQYEQARTVLAVPLLREKELVGAIAIWRREVRPFNDKQIELVRNFAAQAAIAIENARLLNELRELLEQQTGTAEVLRVISSSPGELQPVFDTMLVKATELCEASYGAMWLREGDGFRNAAFHGALPPEYVDRWRSGTLLHPGTDTPMVRVVQTRQPVQVADLRDTLGYRDREPLVVAGVDIAGIRTLMSIPMFKAGEVIGTITIYRKEVRPFSDKQIDLVTNFASQAVIAIENTQLLSELRQRTDDLTESLEQQTATAEILQVISNSPTDSQPVFDAIVQSGLRLFSDAAISLVLRDGDMVKAAAINEADPKRAQTWRDKFPVPLTRAYVSSTVILDSRTIDIPDVRAAPAELAAGAKNFFDSGYLAVTAVPMMRGDIAVGALSVMRRTAGPLTEKQLALVKTFASQAIIAIENSRLFNELRQRTDDLTESLQQQTATADVLKIISRSAFDLQTVLDTLVESAARLCEAESATIHRPVGDAYPFVASHGYSKEYVEFMEANPIKPNRGSVLGRAVLQGETVHVADVKADPEYTLTEVSKLGGFRTVLGVPLMREGTPIGVIMLTRSEVRPFTGKQIALAATFADQAVIAIENVRLFDEVQARTRDLQELLEYQTATSEILTVISRSPTDGKPVFDIIGERAEKLCDADVSVVSMVDGELIQLVSIHGVSSEGIEAVRGVYPMRRDHETITARAVRSGAVAHVPDVLVDAQFAAKDAARAAGYHACLGVPMMREGQVIGTIFVARMQPGYFSDTQVQLLKTFADQAVIAIGNVRLFEEVQARTEDLQESLAQQTATADVLKIISRSAFDLNTVLDTLLRSAARLCEADQGTITQRIGDKFYRSVAFGYPQEFIDYVKDKPVEMDAGTASGRALLEAKVVHIPDVAADPGYKWTDLQKLGDYRAVLGVPMLREGEPIGILTLSRTEPRAFTDKQIELVTTFADQAAIAIENVRLFDEIQEKSRQLEEASKHKSQFLANMSHELRTPLNAILGYTELIADGVYGETPEKVQTTIQRIITNGKHLLGLINDVLDLSKIEAGQLTLSLADYSMKDVVHAVYGAVEPLAMEKKLAFKAEIAPDLPIGHGDERRLTQVLLNLVGNAIKFTDEGSVAIKADVKDAMFSVAVVDTGPGISETDKPRLFQEFQQADSSTTKKKGGTGLGLAISKRIIEMHGGSVSLESRVGEGSTFSFTVPVRAEQAKTAT